MSNTEAFYEKGAYLFDTLMNEKHNTIIRLKNCMYTKKKKKKNHFQYHNLKMLKKQD